MHKIIFVTILIFLFAMAANAQGAVSYSFLEVVDYAAKPVADAKVRVEGSCVGGEHITDQKGQIKGGLPIGFGDCQTHTFQISKDGYFTFFDIFGLSKYRTDNLKIELLLNPKNRSERRLIGSEQTKREFFAAARAGDTPGVRKFIKSGLSPNLTTRDLRGVPAPEDEPIILYAVRSGSGETVKEFLTAGVKVDKNEEPVKSILTAYLYAYPFNGNFPESEAGDAAKISLYEDGAIRLIEAGANIDPAGKGSLTPLMLAAQQDYVRIAKKLIEKGAFVDAQDGYGRTALMYLIKYEKPKTRLEIANLLIKAGANVNLLTSRTSYSKYNVYSCKTALTTAVEGWDVELVKLLLANGADVNLTCDGGYTPLNYAREISDYATAKEKKEIIEILEAAGARE